MTAPVIDPAGREWRPFAIEFDSPDGVFQFMIHALSHDHAQLLVAEIRASATLVGEVVARIPNG